MYPPFCFLAVACKAAASDPAPDSLKQNAPISAPEVRPGSILFSDYYFQNSLMIA